LPRGSSEPVGEAIPPHDQIIPLQAVADIKYINTPTVVDHYQLRRVFDVYIMPRTEDLGRVGTQIEKIVNSVHPPHGTIVSIAGSVNDMHEAFRSFAIGLVLSVILVYLILMAQFTSFSDPFVILLAVPPGMSGVLLFLLVTCTSLNIMSLMGMLMMTGIVVSDSILIVDFIGIQRAEGKPLRLAINEACRVRLRPIAMTTLATALGLIPMALGLEAGSEQYAPLARAILGGLTVSGVVTVFLVPTVYFLIHRNHDHSSDESTATATEVRA
jgi:multidrug efflux pump subunit AcrB